MDIQTLITFIGAFDPAIGVVVSLIGSIGHSVGFTLQKKAHNDREIRYGFSELNSDPEMPNVKKKPPPVFLDPTWLTGFIVYISCSGICPAVALLYLPVFVAAPLSAVNLAANTICAGLILGRKITRNDYFNTALVTIGAIWIAIFATIKESSRSLDDLLKLYKRPIFIIYFVLYEVMVFVLIIIELRLRNNYKKLRERVESALELENKLRKNKSSVDVEDVSLNMEDTLSKLSIQNVENTPQRDGYKSDSTNIAGGSRSGSKISIIEDTPLLGDSKNVSGAELHWFGSKTNVLKSGKLSKLIPFCKNQMYDQPASSTAPLLGSEPEGQGTRTNYGIGHLDEGQPQSQVLLVELNSVENKAGLLSGLISGFVCSQSILFTKTSIELISFSLKEKNQFTTPLAWLIVSALVVAALGNLYYFNRGLRLSSTIVLVPLAFSSYTLSALINSLIYYDQFNKFTTSQIINVLIGLSTVFVGVFLSSRSERSHHEV